MKLFDVYPLFDVSLQKGKGAYVWDTNGMRYLDFYGGHAVISIGHAQEHYVRRVAQQLEQLSFYSNSVHLAIQDELAEQLGKMCAYPEHQLFLVNSGAEAIENALKVASFHNGRKKVIAFKGAFHGRTAGAVAVTDNPKIKALINEDHHVLFLPFEDKESLRHAFEENEICAVILEPIQGVNGIYEVSADFLQFIRSLCTEYKALFIADEIQCGYGRSGKFFTHQWAGVEADIITMAKGMGNGFPVGGILIHPEIQAKHGMLGTTFGGSPLACAAALGVLEVMASHDLMHNALCIGDYLIDACRQLPGVREVRGRGLMIGVEFEFPIKALRDRLVYEQHVFVGNSSNPNTIRLLPSLAITQTEADELLDALKKCLA